MQKLIFSETDCIVKANLRMYHTENTMEAQMNTLKTDFADVSARLREDLYRYMKHVFTEMTLKDASNDL